MRANSYIKQNFGISKVLFFPNVDRHVFVASQLATRSNPQLRCPCTFYDKMFRLRQKKRRQTDRQFAYNVTLRRVSATIVEVVSSKYYIC